MVAHRIMTVIDCDKILVMSQGTIVEQGHPHELLSKYLPPIPLTTPYSTDGESLGLPIDNETADETADVTADATRILSSAPLLSPNTSLEPLQPFQAPPKHSFASMVLETGPIMTRELQLLAMEAWKRRNSYVDQ